MKIRRQGEEINAPSTTTAENLHPRQNPIKNPKPLSLSSSMVHDGFLTMAFEKFFL